MSATPNRVKGFAIVSAIFIPLTFLVGVWGMNFDPQASPWNMPESTRTRRDPMVSRYFEPVTVPAAPRNVSVVGFVESVSVGQTLAAKRRQRIVPEREQGRTPATVASRGPEADLGRVDDGHVEIGLGGEVRPGEMGAEHLALMAGQLGMQPRFLAQQARDMADRVPTAIDQAAREIGNRLAGGIRQGPDVLARFALGEWALLLPHTGLDGAVAVAQRCLERVNGQELRVGGSTVSLCVSAGVAAHQPVRRYSVDTVGMLLQAAERAQRQSSALGGGRAVGVACGSAAAQAGAPPER